MQTVHELIQSKLSRLRGDPRVREESALIEKIERTEEELAPLLKEALAIGDKIAVECENFACDQYRRRNACEGLIEVENWPDDVSTESAIRALLKTTFNSERREYLSKLHQDAQAKCEPLRVQLREVKAQLAKVQAELQKG